MKFKNDALPTAQMIRKAAKGLVYISETDAPIEYFSVEATAVNSAEEKFSQFKKGLGVAGVRETSPDELFARLIAEDEWKTPAEILIAKRFRELQRTLCDNLTDIRVLRFGTVRVDIYVLGVDAEGNLSGIRTSAVET